MKIEADSVEEYISTAPEARRGTLRKLRITIMETLPGLEEYMDHGMPTYRLDRNLVAYASQKHYISVYFFDEEQRNKLADNFPGLSHGISCVRFKEKDDFPYDALKRVLKASAG